KDRPSRCLWACQRRHGLQGRHDLGHREERPLLNAQKHLRRAAVIPRPAKAFVAFAAIAVLLLAGFPAQGQNARMVATTMDLASLARSVAGDLASVEVMIPPGADPESFEPRPSDLAKLKDAAIVIRVGLGYDHWLDKLPSPHGGKERPPRGAWYGPCF